MTRLLSVNVGLPKEVAWSGRTVWTGIWKAPVQGRRFVRPLNIEGDGQGDLVGHGGEQRAVLVYQMASYRHWAEQFGRNDFTFGQFGENFTIDGLPDDEACIGDRYRIGSAVFEVTQPRVTCYRVGIRMGEPRMAALLVSHLRPGFYLRVIEEGDVGAGDEITQVAAGPERMTVSEVNTLLYLPGHPRDKLQRVLRIPALSAGWQDSFRALLRDTHGDSEPGNPGLAPLSGPRPAWSGFHPVHIAEKRRESDDVVSLALEPPRTETLPLPRPGQFIVARMRPEPAGAPLLRSYSLSGMPSTRIYRIGVKREPQGIASAYLHDRAKVGDRLEVSAPRGNFMLDRGDGPVVLLSAGIGITPVLSILHALAADRSAGSIRWIYGARDAAHHPFADETRQLLARLPNATAEVLYSRAASSAPPGIGYDARGRVTMGVLEELRVQTTADFFLCGPWGFMRDLRTGLLHYGVSARHIHAETFGAGESRTPGLIHVDHRAPRSLDVAAGNFSVAFARSGVRAGWNDSYLSLLEVAEACDVPVRWSCRTGVCHSCEIGLVAGTVKYDPDPLDLPAEGNVLTCCSQPRGDVVIDL
jgi:ferredoxin-NADP reductase/MOSC domain-containing protein YiiM/ferredoxin